jgi:hypothetical protein
MLIAIMVLVTLTTAACGGSGLDAPEPGSMADRMCDTNETGPGYVTKGGKNYDAECLDSYPWEA